MSKKQTNKQTSKSSAFNASPAKFNYRFFLLASFILIAITSLVYLKSVNNSFTKWDDDSYISNNPDIKTLQGDSISYTLNKTFTSYVMGNYHPLTMLSYCLEYKYFNLNTKAYHITNLVFHLLNTLLVFCFVWLLSERILVAFITSLLFAIHPMHVESVAWVAERKDVLYSFFYLTSLCFYLLFLKKENNKKIFFVLSFILFLCGVLSKAMAVSLPLMLFAIDYLKGRNSTKKTILEKVPFLLLSLIFGVIAILAQKSVEAFYDLGNYNFFDRIIFSCYGIINYLWKIFLPVNLSCYYSYPDKQGGFYPLIFYVAPFILIGLIYLNYKSLKFGKEIVFGFLFFLITIILVLQILPVGGTFIAERYTYLPYIGIFYILAHGISYLIENKNLKIVRFKTSVILLTTLFILFLSYQSYKRTFVWRDGLSLWNDAIEKNDKSPLPFKSRAVVFFNERKFDKAIADLNRAIALKNDYSEAYNLRGQCYNEKSDYIEALNDFSKAIIYNPKYAVAYNNRGIAYYNSSRFAEAINDYNTAIKLDTKFVDSYNNRGNAYFKISEFENAIADYTNAIHLNSSYVLAYYGRGLSKFYLGKIDEAIDDYSNSLKLNKEYVEAYINRGNAYFDSKRYNEAINDYTSALNYSPLNAKAYYYRSGTYFTLKQFKLALADALKAKELGYNVDERFVEILKMNSK